MSIVAESPTTTTTPTITNGADVLIESLIRQKVDILFAYPGGASMPLHQSLRKRRDNIRTILPRHEQGGGFAAQGYARTTGRVGVCMATSGPGATNLVTALADAKLDSIPLIAITGQVPQYNIGKDAFQETPVVEVCRAVTKHHYLVTDIADIPRIVNEAFYIANTGRPGPVLIDVPKDVQLTKSVGNVDYNPPFDLPGYRPDVRLASKDQIKTILSAIRLSERPILYIGGGCNDYSTAADLKVFVDKTNIPVTSTVMGLGVFPGEDPRSLHMLGMHGTVYANKAINAADLILAFGVRFDDRVTGKIEEFCKHGKIVHVDIDPSEINKNKDAHIPVVADIREVLKQLNAALTEADVPRIDKWNDQIAEWKTQYPLSYGDSGEKILAQYAIDELWRQTKDDDAYVSVGVGQHQMWGAQFYKFRQPRHWLSSSGLGTMGFGLPSAMGVSAAFPGKTVIDIDGDGSFQMNIQELATLRCENLPVKILLLNNQHLGMVVQWEERFHNGNRAHTYLGPVDHPEALGDGDGTHYEETYPSFVKIAEGYGIASKQVRIKSEFPAALAEMLAHDGPYLLDVICPYQEHVLPMIPSNGSVKDIITE